MSGEMDVNYDIVTMEMSEESLSNQHGTLFGDEVRSSCSPSTETSSSSEGSYILSNKDVPKKLQTEKEQVELKLKENDEKRISKEKYRHHDEKKRNYHSSSEKRRSEEKKRHGSRDESDGKKEKEREKDREKEKDNDKDKSRKRDKDADKDKKKRRSSSRDRRRERSRHSSSSHRRTRSRSPHERRSSKHRSYSRKDSPSSRRHRDRNMKRSRSRSRERMRPHMGYEKKPSKLSILERLGIELKPPGGGTMTPQMTLQKTMEEQCLRVKNATGIELPSYYNPLAVNPSKYAEQMKKRKMLWGGTQKQQVASETVVAKPEVESAEGASASSATNPVSLWEGAAFSQDQDGKLTAKFKRLMGIKGSESGNSNCNNSGENELIKKQEEMFNSMEMQYEVARVSTHTHRGLGLGFGVHQYPR